MTLSLSTAHFFVSICILLKLISGQDWLTLKANTCQLGTNACTGSELETIRAVLYANGNTYSFTLDVAGAIATLTNTAFVPAHQTVIFVYGYVSTNDSESAVTMKDAYAPYDYKTNFMMILTDMVYGGIFLNLSNYIRASQQTVCVGHRIGDYLAALSLRGVKRQDIHLIGHSLGAQTIHAACQRFISLTSTKVHRATGLDPAGPCFDPDTTIQLNRHDADLVDTIHTNALPLGMGTGTELGQARFIANGGSVQIGCSVNVSCSHNRAHKYYANSMKSDLCIASPAISLRDFNNKFNRNSNNVSVQMGYNWNGSAGSFYLRTKSVELFCDGKAGINKAPRDVDIAAAIQC